MKAKRKDLKKICLTVAVIYIFAVISFWAISKNELTNRVTTNTMLTASQALPEIVENVVVEQSFIASTDEIISVTLQMATYARDYNVGNLYVSVVQNDTVLAAVNKDISTIKDNTVETFIFDTPIKDKKNQELILRITSDAKPGYGVTIMYGNAISTIKGSIAADPEKLSYVNVDGINLNGQLCYQIATREALWYGAYYFHFATVVGIFLVGYLLYMVHCNQRGKFCKGLLIICIFEKYGFLISQLVARDFKNKYKRSILGMLWSFLNPLLTMLVQYFVFSNIFKSDTENFVVYLLTGIVFFNFYSEASNMAMSSITGNSSLITKVYVPKYIYPLSRILSSGINFLISLIPLLLMMVITQVKVTPATVLVIYPIICTFILSLGIGLILASIMVFFRDTQFIYGVVLTALMYFTPIFYPISIIPERFQWLLKLNPISNNIVFARSCILDGVFPGMELFLICGLFPLIALLVGIYIFRKTQDRFILHI